MKMEVYQYTDMELQVFANQVKDNVISTLGQQGLLTESVEKIAGNCIVNMGHKGMFGRFFDKLRGIKDDRFMVVNIMNPMITPEVEEANG